MLNDISHLTYSILFLSLQAHFKDDMRIPDSKIEEIRNSANIVDIISSYVQLKKRGRNFIGLCPFHQEKTPSFTVTEEKQIYHCFGCGAGGNVFKFLMEYKSISFIEAVQEIADSLGISLEYEQGNVSEAQNEQEVYYDINVKAAKYFSDNLLKSLAGEPARQYLLARKLTEKTMRTFGLGFAMPGWDTFLKHAREEKIDLENAKTLGLIDKRESGDYYDKFRNRIMYPIFSPNGRVIAFGGRIMDDTEQAAKYLNSPESIIYYKRRSLYGLYHAKDEIRKLDKAILVEGYMDVIALFQGGVKNVVASSGTSLTEEQVLLISRYTKNIVLLFDADNAGQKASLRSIELLLKQNFEVKIATLPDGEDPDSYINNFGRESFNEQISKAENFLEYQTAQFQKAGLFDDPNKQADAIREMVKSASLVADDLKRNLLIKTIAKRFSLREKLIETELMKFQNEQQRKETRNDAGAVRKSRESNQKVEEKPKENLREKELVKLLLSGEIDVMDKIISNIEPEEFDNPTYRKLAETIYELYNDEIHDTSAIIEKIIDDDLNRITRTLAIAEESISKKWEEIHHDGRMEVDLLKYTDDILRIYKVNKLEEQIKANNSIISGSADEAQIMELLKVNKELQKEKKTLLSER